MSHQTKQLSPNFHGKKGRSGRKSFYQEQADARELWDIWNKKYPRDYATLLGQKKKRSPKEVWIGQLLVGNERALHDLYSRLYPEEWKGDMHYEGVFKFIVIPTLPHGVKEKPHILEGEIIPHEPRSSAHGETAILPHSLPNADV